VLQWRQRRQQKRGLSIKGRRAQLLQRLAQHKAKVLVRQWEGAAMAAATAAPCRSRASACGYARRKRVS
jgi:hypothetical protein